MESDLAATDALETRLMVARIVTTVEGRLKEVRFRRRSFSIH